MSCYQSLFLLLFLCSSIGLSSIVTASGSGSHGGRDEAWSRSLPSDTVAGFPVFAQHAVFAQDTNSGILFAFDVHDGSILWNTSFDKPNEDCMLPPGQRFFPHALDTGFTDMRNRHFVVMQSALNIIAFDLYTGSCVWVNTDLYRGNAHVYQPVMSADQRFVMVAAPPVRNPPPPFLHSPMQQTTGDNDKADDQDALIHVTGLDVVRGAPAWQHQTDSLCNFFPSGSPMPVVVTERTFFGCFMNPNFQQMQNEKQKRQQNKNKKDQKNGGGPLKHGISNLMAHVGAAAATTTNTMASASVRGGPPAPSIVKEVELTDNAFHCRVFDFSPRTVLMTPKIQFFTHNKFNKRQEANNQQKPPMGDHPGDADRVGFLISMFDLNTNTMYGPSTLVSVIAQAGMVEWTKTLFGLPVSFAAVQQHPYKAILLTDAKNYVASLSVVDGSLFWNTTVPQQMNFETMKKTNVVGDDSVATLGLIDHFAVSKEHVVLAQPCHASNGPVKGLTVLALEGDHAGSIVRQTALDTWNPIPVNVLVFNNFVYFSTAAHVNTLDVGSGEVAKLAPTNSPVGSLVFDDVDNRILFGTQYAIFCMNAK